MKIITNATIKLDTTKSPSESLTLQLNLRDIFTQRDIIKAQGKESEGIDVWLIHPMPPIHLYGIQVTFKIGMGKENKK